MASSTGRTRTVIAGSLPPASSVGEVIVTPQTAATFHLRVGGHMTWQFFQGKLVDGLPVGSPHPAQRVTLRIAAIADVAPALVDTFDNVETAILPPAATTRFLNGEWQFGWVSLQQHEGDAGVPALRLQLSRLAAAFTRRTGFPVTFTIRRLAVVQHEAEQAIEPQAVSLAVLSALAVLALLGLMAQGLSQLLARPAADAAAPRSTGAGRTAAAAATGAWGLVAVASAAVISVGGAIAVSPLAPVWPVRAFDPARGVQG